MATKPLEPLGIDWGSGEKKKPLESLGIDWDAPATSKPVQPQAPSKITPNMTEKEFDATWSKMPQSERKASNVAAYENVFGAGAQAQPEKTKEQRLNAALERNIQTLPPPPRANPSMLLGGLKKTVNSVGDTIMATNPFGKIAALPDLPVNLAITTARDIGRSAKSIPDSSPFLKFPAIQMAKRNADKFEAIGSTPLHTNPITLQAQEQKSKAVESLKEGKGEFGKLAVDVGIAGADMATSAAISKITGLPYLAVQGMFGGAETANQALAEGHSADKALTAGTASGLATAGIESLGGIGGNVGSKIIGKLAASSVGKAALSKAPAAALYLLKASDSVIGKILGSAGAEAIEEFTEYDAQRVLNNLILDKDTPRDVKEQLRNTLIGGVLGGAFGGASAYNGVQADKANEQQAVNNYMAQGNAIRREFTGADINPTNPALGDMFIQQARKNTQGKNQATAQPQVSSTQAQFEEAMKQAVERKAQASSTQPVQPFGENTVGAARHNIAQDKSVRRSVPNPIEIAKMTEQQASTTPPLRQAPEVGGDKRSKFADSIQGKQTIFDERFKELATDRKNIQSYEGVTNNETLAQANDKLNNGGYDYVATWHGKQANYTAEDIATGFVLMDRYQTIGDYEGMLNAAEKLRKMGTQAGQAVQAFSIMGRMTPEGMTLYAQKSLSDAFEYMVKGKTQKWINDNADKFKLTGEDIEFIQKRTSQAAQLPHGRDKMVLLGEISARIQNKTPPTIGQSVKALARMSMLLNPKTNMRNVLGNAVVTPQHLASDFIGAGIDKVIASRTGVRTTGLPQASSLKAAGKGLYESYDDFRRGINTRDMSGDRFEIGQGLNFGNETLLGKSLNSLDRVTNFLLDAGDRPFYETWFINSLNNQMRLNEVAQPTADMIDIATQEALQRTWQDSNSYTGFVSSVRSGLNKINVKGYGVGDVILPFVKTPANLTKALVDYSPIGLTRALASEASAFSNAVKTGRATPQMQRQFVKSISQGITGTLIYAIFAGLADKGLLKGEGDKDKDVANFMRNVMGDQPYSVKIGSKSYSYAWAQPVAGAAAITADVVQNIKSGNPKQYITGDDEVTRYANIILSAIQSGGNVLYEQSFMQGLQNLFSQDNVVKGLMESILGEPSKFTPQFLAQIAQYQDPIMRTSYAYGQPLETALNKVKAKIPRLSQTLEPVVDVFGRDVKRNGGDNSIFNVFFNPANVASESRTAAADEAYRLYQSTGDKQVIPPVAPYYFTVGDSKVVMTVKQRTEYRRTTGQLAEKELSAMLGSKQYKALRDTDKSKMVKEIYSYATAVAKSRVSSYQLDGVNEKVFKASNQGVPPYQYLRIRSTASTDGNEGVTQDEMELALNNEILTKSQRFTLFALQNSTWKTNPYK